jgi:hypothetical protein
LVDLIIHLNDYHEWSRERIADFVEKVEAKCERSNRRIAKDSEPALETAEA